MRNPSHGKSSFISRLGVTALPQQLQQDGEEEATE